MPRYFLEVMYDGVSFNGSQLQGAQPTVQLALNNALSTILRTDLVTFGASRTDADVHALCNYYHFDYDEILNTSFVYNINSVLPAQVAVKRLLKSTDPELNARFAASTRRYRYRIFHQKDPFRHKRALYYPYKIDDSILHETAAILTEYTNFESFSKRNTQSRTFNCKIISSYWQREPEELHYVVEANRFLRGMVRALVGTQLQAASGKMSVEQFRAVIESRDCSRAYFNVAGHGLYLEHITYPENSFEDIT
jgi:tRNA pseudouridine38-40 synthase